MHLAQGTYLIGSFWRPKNW